MSWLSTTTNLVSANDLHDDYPNDYPDDYPDDLSITDWDTPTVGVFDSTVLDSDTFVETSVPKRESFSKDELHFLETTPLSFIEIECPICLQVMLKDPHLTSCGHHFCGPCIKRVYDCNGTCPTCKEKNYQTFPDRNRLRLIKGLQVYCTNKESGCQWKGELKDLIGHIDKRKRNGECHYEKVDCRYLTLFYGIVSENEPEPPTCSKTDQRHILDLHEKDECPCRPYECQYCNYKTSYQIIVNHHYNKCLKYPVPCTNKCTKGETYPRESLQCHLNKECPLQPVECEFKWAGCHEKPLRKDLPQHVNNSMMDHFKLLAVACGEMKKEIEETKKEMGKMKKKNEEMKRENKQVKEKNQALVQILTTKGIITKRRLESEMEKLDKYVTDSD